MAIRFKYLSNFFRPNVASVKLRQDCTAQAAFLKPLLFCGPLLEPKLKSVAVPTKMQVRFAHTDIEQPDWEKYRRKSLRDPNKSTQKSEKRHKLFTYMLNGCCMSAALYAAKSEILRDVKFIAASAEVLALAQVEVKLGDIPEGSTVTYKWRGKPLFIKHRTQEEIERERAVPLSELRDPQTDEERCPKPEWLIVIGVCTHLGCIPIPGQGDYPGGSYCPCHGSHYDGAGRARKGPAPSNLEIPKYSFPDDNTVIVG